MSEKKKKTTQTKSTGTKTAKTTPAKPAPAKTASPKAAPAKPAPAKEAIPKAAPPKPAPAKEVPPKAAPPKAAPPKPAPAKEATPKAAPPKAAPVQEAPAKARAKVVLREGLILKEAAERMKMKPKDLLDKLAAKRIRAELTEFVDENLAAAISRATSFDVEFVGLEEEMRLQSEAKPENLRTRPPVVTIMGHVDHGKTTLLDAIRSSKLVDKESGGITQHIGAYQVAVKDRSITFIDTPGHEAFTQLRSRGARLTDIVVLVVAADDGIMPQTKEAINHARAADVPIIVAINKIDKPEANTERVKQQLSKENLLVEEWGGKTISVELSAKDKKNIDELLEMILLLADILEIKANPEGPAQGIVLEARLDSQKGPVGTVVLMQGTLATGEAFVAGTVPGKVRALFDEKGRPLKSAGPSTPVEIMGFTDVPLAGDHLQVVVSPMSAKAVADFRSSRLKKAEAGPSDQVTLDELFKRIEQGQSKELALVLKADVQGSVEVLMDIIPPLGTEKVKIRIVHAATGTINEADVLLASASKAIVIGYNVKPAQKILDLARKENVEIRSYKIIYQLTDEIKKAVIGLLEPIIREVYLGRAEIRKVFQIPKTGTIAGCYVQDGKITRNSEIRVLRNKEVIHQGRISSLKHVKENVTEVKKDYECGIGLDKFQGFQPGDVIESFVKEKVKAT
jgi:translation initiation factor IF-2